MSLPVPGDVLAFVHVQKTAGTSMKFMLKNSFGARHCDIRPVDPARNKPVDLEDLAFARRIYPRLQSIGGHELIEPTAHLAGAVRPYTMLRDPVSRAVSHFQDQNLRGHAPPCFDEYIDNELNHDFQVRKIAGGPDLEKARRLLREEYFFVGLTERFDESMRVLASFVPYPLDLRYVRRNVARDNRFRDAVMNDDSRRARIEAANRLDRALFEWVRDEWYPTLRSRAPAEALGEPLPVISDRPVKPARYVASRAVHRLRYLPALKRARRRRNLR